MQEVVAAGIDHLFRERGLHRIMASYMPREPAKRRAPGERLGSSRRGIRSGLSDDQRPLGGPRPHRAHQSAGCSRAVVANPGWPLTAIGFSLQDRTICTPPHTPGDKSV